MKDVEHMKQINSHPESIIPQQVLAEFRISKYVRKSGTPCADVSIRNPVTGQNLKKQVSLKKNSDVLQERIQSAMRTFLDTNGLYRSGVMNVSTQNSIWLRRCSGKSIRGWLPAITLSTATRSWKKSIACFPLILFSDENEHFYQVIVLNIVIALEAGIPRADRMVSVCSLRSGSIRA